MKIISLNIKNFKAIKNVIFEDLGDTILIAGPNGCGKSCIFHAIRLLKSVIGGYQHNEWHLWFNEFQIKPQSIAQEICKLFQTEDRELKIEAKFELSEDEIKFLKKEASELLEFQIWKRKVPTLVNSHYKERPLGSEYNALKSQIKEAVKPQVANLLSMLRENVFSAKFSANKNGKIVSDAPLPLELIFSIYGEESIGVIDYHSANRDYQREELNNINLNLHTTKQSMQKNSLYNQVNKYKNVKQEMAGDYIRRILIEKSGGSTSGEIDLIDTLKELFAQFFPGKEFLGPVPNKDGGIEFPVKMENGKLHDINDLSSGEKEVLYGYLRLRFSAPRNSIIMLDEPELHLNPGLISGLPQFYKKHLGESLNNQLWLVTHSDEFLRQAVDDPGYNVYHLQVSGKLPYTENQIKRINAKDSLESAVIDIVGDLAAFGPDKKIVFLEGENSEFDMKMISRLFPKFAEAVNLISVGSKSRVEKLHDLMEKATRAGSLGAQYFSIVDKDLGEGVSGHPAKAYQWDVYHIENYLLEESYISDSVRDLTLGKIDLAPERVRELLVECSKDSIDKLISTKIKKKVWSETTGDLDFGYDPTSKEISKEIYNSMERSFARMNKKLHPDYKKSLEELEAREREIYEKSFESEEWRKVIKGRDTLKSFVTKLSPDIRYDVLRNTIISKMSTAGHKPEGMLNVIEGVLSK